MQSPRFSAARRPRSLAVLALFAGMIALTACSILKPVAAPARPLTSLEGHGSLRVSGERGTARSNVSFVLQLPDHGRLDVFDVLGRPIASLIVLEPETYGVFPSRKLYCRGSRDAFLERFLGYRLTLAEMAALLSGEWDAGTEAASAAWVVTRDARGRVRTAERPGLRFEVNDYFPGTTTPHVLAFTSPSGRGSLKVAEVRFNVRLKDSAFRIDFLSAYEEKAWEDIERLLADEDELLR